MDVLVEYQQHRVGVERDVAENRFHRVHHPRDILPPRPPRVPIRRARRVRGEADGLPIDHEAVHLQPADGNRHIDQLMVALDVVLAGGSARALARHDLPLGLASDGHPGRKVERGFLRIPIQVRAVEECDIQREPGCAAYQLIGQIVELDPHLTRLLREHPPRTGP
jgi:hypothetical protein